MKELEPSLSEQPAIESPTTDTPNGAAERVDELDNIDFLLEEIENKIAPLALA